MRYPYGEGNSSSPVFSESSRCIYLAATFETQGQHTGCAVESLASWYTKKSALRPGEDRGFGGTSHPGGLALLVTELQTGHGLVRFPGALLSGHDRAVSGRRDDR